MTPSRGRVDPRYRRDERGKEARLRKEEARGYEQMHDGPVADDDALRKVRGFGGYDGFNKV